MTTQESCSQAQKQDSITAVSETPKKLGDVTYRPALDLYDTEAAYEIRLDMPGTTPEGIDVTVHDGVLTVEARVEPRYQDGITPVLGEFGVGDYRRRIRLGEDIDLDTLRASYADGVLVLVLPKLAAREPRKIEVRAG